MAFAEVDLNGTGTLVVHDLVKAIDEAFPFATAADGDRVGLLVGDANATVTRVLIALDAGLDVLAQAQELGANVIISHHPVYLDTPEHFNITHAAYTYPARVIHAAAAADIAIIAAHTNLDLAQAARSYWGEILELEHSGQLPPLEPADGFPRIPHDPTGNTPAPGFGELWRMPTPRSLKTLAAEVANVTGRCVRVYGNDETLIETVVTATGSGSSRIPEALFAKADVIVAGEFRYHDALAAVESGLTLIEMGHDVSELPLLDLLAECVHARTHLPDEALHIIREPKLWNCIATGTLQKGQS